MTQATQQTVESATVLSRLFREWDEHASTYAVVEYRVALVKDAGSWRAILTLFVPRHAGDPDAHMRVDYGDVLLITGTLSVEDAKTTLERIVHHGELELPNAPKTSLLASLHERSAMWRPSQFRLYPITFPETEYRFSVPDDQRANVPRDILAAPDLPLFPQVYAAIAHYLGVRLLDQGAQHTELVALVPDYRASIEEVRLAISGATIRILTASSDTRVIGKSYYDDHHGQAHHDDLNFVENIAIIPTNGYPRTMLVALLTPDGDLIDEWHYDAYSPYAQHGVIMERDADDIEHLIAGGESEMVEFKEKLREGAELAPYIAAFANTHGGTLIIGVDDDGVIVGCDTTKIKDRVTNVVRDDLRPVPVVRTNTYLVEEKTLVVMNVAEAADKPVVVKDKGVYVRAGATKRQATRDDLDRLYAAKNPGHVWTVSNG